MAEITYHNNPALPVVLPGWKGNPKVNGRFIDPNKRFSGSFKKFLRWQFSKKEKAEEKKNDRWRLQVQKDNSFLRQSSDCLVWLGHASFFIQMGGIRLITDPVFGRISGVVPRYSELPCADDDFRDIHYVLLSHAHRDHCDAYSLKKLAANNRFQLLTSLETGKLVSSWIDNLHFQEAGWYQTYQLPENNLKITYLPAQHWSNRFGWDTNKFLWGSFMINYEDRYLYFGADSGYCSYPAQVSELFPSIDIAMIGVGAYTPSFMMQDVHTNPQEAIQVFHDLKAKTFVPMHYGTFDLADEPLGEPYRILTQAEKEGTIKGTLEMLQPGQVLWL